MKSVSGECFEHSVTCFERTFSNEIQFLFVISAQKESNCVVQKFWNVLSARREENKTSSFVWNSRSERCWLVELNLAALVILTLRFVSMLILNITQFAERDVNCWLPLKSEEKEFCTFAFLFHLQTIGADYAVCCRNYLSFILHPRRRRNSIQWTGEKRVEKC